MLIGRRDNRDDADLLDEGYALLRDGQVSKSIIWRNFSRLGLRFHQRNDNERSKP